MPHPIFELDAFRALPLWAQVLLASRLIRRAILALPGDDSERPRQFLLSACDALDRCARAGERLTAEIPILNRAAAFQPTVMMHGVAVAAGCAADAAHAAHDSLDLSAAETACSNSVARAVSALAESPGLSSLQIRIFAASDVDLLAFACKECGVGRYDGLPSGVWERLTPIIPLPKQPPPTFAETDPAGGAR